jgi:hypothetical protein
VTGDEHRDHFAAEKELGEVAAGNQALNAETAANNHRQATDELAAMHADHERAEGALGEQAAHYQEQTEFWLKAVLDALNGLQPVLATVAKVSENADRRIMLAVDEQRDNAEAARLDRRRGVRFTSLGLVAILVLTAGLLGVAWQNRQNGQKVKDCVTASGQCYREQQKRTTAAVGQIVAGNAAATRREAIYVVVAFRTCTKPNPNITDGNLTACIKSYIAAHPQ